jgi:pimeloyl-ACP methyl ester carboxylesterase/carbon monoxide dehydrogenase subunit G
MRLDFAGDHRIAAPRRLVWDLLLDPEAVRRCAHGVERIEVVDATHWVVHIAVGVGPLSIRMHYRTLMRNLREPESAEMWLDGTGAGTEMRLRTGIRLVEPEPGLTHLHWDADAEVEGMAAGLGRRLVEATARGFTTDFWRRFAEDAARHAARETAERPVPAPEARVTRRRLTLDQLPVRMVADVYGDGRGTPLVLLHGMWCERGMFRRMAEELARTRQVIVPDLRAHGETAVARPGWGVEDLAQDVVRMLDALGLPRADVLGFSMGGMAALPLVLRWPERVRALVLVSASAEPEGPVRHGQMRLLAGVLRRVGVQPALIEPAVGYMFSPAFQAQSPDTVRDWFAGVEGMTAESLAQATDAVANRPDWTSRLGEIHHPALVVAGSVDTTMPPPHSERLAEALPRGRYVSLAEVGHGVPVERPHDLAAVVREFLDGQGTGEQGAGREGREAGSRAPAT